MHKSKSKKTPPESIKHGRWERWGSRVFLQDAHGGLFTLREQMVKEIGPEFTSDIFYRAGFASAERLMVYVQGQAEAEKGLNRLDFALDLLTQSGYGNISVEQERVLSGEITIHVENSMEGEIFRDSPGRTGYLCDYLRGLLQGIVQALPKTDGYPEGQVDCVEIRCQANGDSQCRFIVAAPAQSRPAWLPGRRSRA